MTTITLREETKEELRAIKPDALTWDEYLHLVLQSLDPDRYAETLEGFFEEEIEDVVERARERYEAAREDPGRMLDPDDAREQIRELRSGDRA